jgi:hypothetical protein
MIAFCYLQLHLLLFGVRFGSLRDDDWSFYDFPCLFLFCA